MAVDLPGLLFSSHSRVGQRGAEVFAYVGLQHRVKVLKFPVCDEANYEDLSASRDTLIRRENAARERGSREGVGRRKVSHSTR